MAGPQDIHIQVEADAAAATRSSKLVADELTRVVGNVAKLETQLRQILTGQLPAKMQEFAQFIQKVESLPGSMNRISQTARTLSSGGPATQLRTATFQGALAGLKTDSSLQALTYEKEMNKVLEARATIFNRMQGTGTSNTAAYRAGLQSLGDGPGTDRKAWMARTLAESKTFEAQRLALVEQNAIKMAQAEAVRMNKQFDAQVAGQAKSLRSEAEFENRRLDRVAANADARMRAEAKVIDRQTTAARRRAAAPTAQERTGAQLQGIQDRFNYNGGAGMLGVQASVLKNYAVVGAVIGSLSYVSKSTVEFQASMKDVQAIAAATDTSMQSLTKTIFQVGSTSKLSMKDLSDGVKILAQAGYSVQQIQTMIKPIADLAVGSGSTLEQSANTITSILSVFDLSITRTAEVSNVLVAGLNQSKLSMEQLGLGIQYAGNIAATGGLQFDEMVAALGAMANAGIKSGSTLGTGLRQIIVQLESPTKKLQKALEAVHLTEDQVNVKTHGLATVMQTLKDAGFSNAEAMTTMGQRAGAAFAALSNNLDVFKSLETTIVGTTAAQDAAGVQMESFSAQWQRLLNAVTQFATVAGGPTLSSVTKLVGGLASLLSGASRLAPVLQTVVALFAAWGTIGLIRYLAGLVIGLNATTGALSMMNVAAIVAARSSEELVAAIGALGAELVIPALIAGLALLILHFGNAAGKQAALTAQLEKFKTAASDAAAQATEYQQRMKEIDKTIEVLSDRHVMLSQNLNAAGAEAEKAIGRFGAWGLSLDANGKHVDGLINKLIELRGQMAAVAHQKALDERGELNKQQGVLKQALGDDAGGIQRAARTQLNSNLAGTLSPQVKAALSNLATGHLGLNDLNAATAVLQGTGNSHFSGLLGIMAPYTRNTVALSSVNGQLQNNAQTLATTNIQSSPQGVEATQAINGMLNAWKTRAAQLSQIKDPVAKAKAMKAEEGYRKDEFAGLKNYLGEQASSLMSIPEIAQGLGGKAGLEGNTLQDQILGTFDTSKLSGLVGDTDHMDEAQLRAAVKRLKGEALTAKKGKDLKTYKSKRDQAAQLLDQADAMAAFKSGETGGATDGIVSDERAAFDEETKRGMMGGHGHSLRGSLKRTAAEDVKALERQIEVASANGGPGAEGIAANQGTLKALTAKWEAAKEAQIKAEATTTQEASQRLDDFRKFEAPKYIDAVLNGNIQAAKDLLAKFAAEAADRTGAASASGVLSGETTLRDGMAKTQEAFNDALAKALDASDQEFRAKGFDPKTAHDAVEKRREINRSFVEKALAAQLTVLQAASDFVALDIQNQQLASDARRGHTAALSNFYGSRHLSDVQRYLGGVANQREDIGDANRDVASKQNDANHAIGVMFATGAALARDPNNAKLIADFTAAKLSADGMNAALAKAKINQKALTEELAPYATLTQAATASWQAYADQAGLAKPGLEQVADGLTGVFQTAHQSFATLVTDVLSGSKSMGQAMKDFATSVLQSMLNMAAQMMANAAIKWLMNMVLSSFGGGDNTMGAPQISLATGGYIRMAGGGAMPGRDSVHVLAEPGEFLMRKSAVDFIGRDNLEQMNAMGNRRASAMPSMASMPKRVPDVTNVYVVAPEAKPQMGKNDVVAVIADDMLTGGKTKQLVKAIMMGAG